jgi:hypothetical protein
MRQMSGHTFDIEYICAETNSNFPMGLNQFSFLRQRNPLYPLEVNLRVTQEMGKQPAYCGVTLLGETLSA